MRNTRTYFNGLVVAPHHLAADAGRRVLKEGGNAIEAMIAAASTIAVVYPHMNSIGGDNFWLLHTPGVTPVGIDACGAAASSATMEFYNNKGLNSIPSRGPLSALTVAGAVSGWDRAFEFSQRNWGGKLPLSRLLEDAAFYAKEGVPVSNTFAENIAEKLDQLKTQPGFSDLFLPEGREPFVGERLKQPALYETLRRLSTSGLGDFYTGKLAKIIADDLQAVGSPVTQEDLARHQAIQVTPLKLEVAGHSVFNMPPPTQGLASLLLLGIYDRLKIQSAESFEFVHAIVESTKQSFRIRDQYIGDPDYMERKAETFLTAVEIDQLAKEVNQHIAQPWPDATENGDTVWLGAIDNRGRAVSFIQSIYWEFGSGVVLPESGITWQNRGTSFSLDETHHNCLQPGRRPFHTIQPALAHLSDGRVMPYGTMGGDGQPQTQAIVFARHVLFGQDLQTAIDAPRWLLGKTWGSESTSLRIENRFPQSLYSKLQEAGHDVEIIDGFDEVMGHAGAIVLHPGGLIEGAADIRSDGEACGF